MQPSLGHESDTQDAPPVVALGPSPGGAAFASAALLLPTVLFLAAPNNVIWRNRLDIPYHWGTTAACVGMFCLAYACCMMLFRLTWRARWARGFARAAIGMSAGVLVFDLATALSAERLHRFVWVAIVDEAVLLLLILAFTRIRFSTLVTLTGVVAPLLFVHAAGTHAAGVYEVVRARGATPPPQLAPPQAEATAGIGNMYHIVLDSFQSQAYPALLKEYPTAALPGFTYYPRFWTNYLYTVYALPTVLSGRLYAPPESVEAWTIGTFRTGLWGTLEAAGVQVALYPYFEGHCPSLEAPCRPAQLAYAEAAAAGLNKTEVAGSTAQTIDLWFLSVLPRSVQTLLDRRLSSLDGPLHGDSGAPRPRFSLTTRLRGQWAATGRRVETEHWAEHSRFNFDRMLEDEAQRSPTDQYVFVHALLPHEPYILNADCGYEPQREGAAEQVTQAYLAQAHCAVRLVQRLVDRLEELDRLEQALIVLHGDHGAYPPVAEALLAEHGSALSPQHGLPRNSNGGPSLSLEDVVRGQAFLAVKFPGTKEFRTDPRTVRMLDLTPTLLHHCGLPVEGLAGSPLQEAPVRPATVELLLADEVRTSRSTRTRAFERFELRRGQWEYTGRINANP